MVQPELLYVFYKSASGMFLKEQIKVVPVIVKCLFQVSTEAPVRIFLEAERNILGANGRNLAYIAVKFVEENGNLVLDAQIRLEAVLEGGEPENRRAHLAGFGSDNPCTNYHTHCVIKASIDKSTALAI